MCVHIIGGIFVNITKLLRICITFVNFLMTTWKDSLTFQFWNHVLLPCSCSNSSIASCEREPRLSRLLWTHLW